MLSGKKLAPRVKGNTDRRNRTTNTEPRKHRCCRRMAIQSADLLYTTNFAFLGLHEAAAATHDPALCRGGEQAGRVLVPDSGAVGEASGTGRWMVPRIRFRPLGLLGQWIRLGLGSLVDRDRLDTILDYVSTGDAQPPHFIVGSDRPYQSRHSPQSTSLNHDWLVANMVYIGGTTQGILFFLQDEF